MRNLSIHISSSVSLCSCDLSRSSIFTEHKKIVMAARAATSTVKAHIPKLRKVCSLSSRMPNTSVQSTNCSLQCRLPVDHFTIKREREKALQTGEPFVKHLVFEKLKVSTKKELNDEPIFFAHRCRHSISGGLLTAFSLEDDSNVSPKYVIFPPTPSDNGAGCGSICNGICSYYDSENFALWNPRTSEFKILPEPPSFMEVYPPGVLKTLSSNEIWFDDKSQDYKVMLFSYLESDNFDHFRNSVIDLYSLKTDSWKKISCPESIYCCVPSACINGVFYMNAYKKADSTDLILSFDLSTEAISFLPVPPHDIDPPTYYILDYNGLVSILSYNQFGTHTSFEQWVMRNGSWDRLSIFQTLNVGIPLHFSRNGELLFFLSSSFDQLLVFDSATGKVKHADGFDSSTNMFKLFPFSESFVKLPGGSYFEEHEKEEEGDDDGQMILPNDGPLMA